EHRPMIIKILGPGCNNCKNLEKATRQALADLDIDATVVKVEDYADIVGYGIMSNPGLVVDDKVLVYGRVPKPAEIKELLTAHNA
ncbi:MAG: thioredoxin family protein, partial [Dermatophilaceae bacterium]